VVLILYSTSSFWEKYVPEEPRGGRRESAFGEELILKLRGARPEVS